MLAMRLERVQIGRRASWRGNIYLFEKERKKNGTERKKESGVLYRQAQINTLDICLAKCSVPLLHVCGLKRVANRVG